MKVFIAGPIKITVLNKIVEEKLKSISKKDYDVLVGDANGVDKAVQKYFLDLNYKNVTVYASNGKARNNLNSWRVENILVNKNLKGREFYAEKDKAMAKDADYGFMIWNGESKGTLNNMVNLLKRNKEIMLFYAPENRIIKIKDFDTLEGLICSCKDETRKTFEKMRRVPVINAYTQLSFDSISLSNAEINS